MVKIKIPEWYTEERAKTDFERLKTDIQKIMIGDITPDNILLNSIIPDNKNPIYSSVVINESLSYADAEESNLIMPMNIPLQFQPWLTNIPNPSKKSL